MTNRPRRTPMTHVDAAWLGMDESTNLFIINCVMFFTEKIEFDRLTATLRERMVMQYDRFTQRVVQSQGALNRLCWEDDPHFDIRSHVFHVALPDPGNDLTLQRFIGRLMSEPLDHARPLWRVYMIDNYGGGCAVLGRIHHAVGDGIALMQVVLSMTDPVPEMPPGRAAEVVRSGASAPESGLLRTTFRVARRATAAMVGAARAANTDPQRAQASARETVTVLRTTGIVAAATTVNLAKLAIMAKDQSPVYRGDLTPIKNVSWSSPIALERVKHIGAVTGATVNDVLVACVAGGLRRYAMAVDGQAPARDIRATIPVNLRSLDAAPSLGNKFSLVYLALPISISDSYQRLYEVKRRMDALKRSPEPLLVYEILNVLGMLPGPLSRRASAWFASKASCVLTNVPGPREPVYFAGHRAERFMFWVPQSRGVGMGISIVSYAGDVTIGLMVDDALVAAPGRVIREFHSEFEDLERLAASVAVGSEWQEQGAAPPPELPQLSRQEKGECIENDS